MWTGLGLRVGGFLFCCTIGLSFVMWFKLLSAFGNSSILTSGSCLVDLLTGGLVDGGGGGDFAGGFFAGAVVVVFGLSLPPVCCAFLAALYFNINK